MSKSSNISKDRWNAAHYSQVKVSVKPDVAANFKAACAAKGVSMAAALSDFMLSYADPASISKHKSDTNPYATRRKRRDTLVSINTQIIHLIAAEESYRDSVPENLNGSKWYEASEQSASLLQDSLDILLDVYS